MCAASHAAMTAKGSNGLPFAAPPGRSVRRCSHHLADQRWWLAGTIKRDEWNGGNAAEMHLEDAALA